MFSMIDEKQNIAPSAETIDSPELGDLVEGLDYRKVVDWAKGQDIPGQAGLGNALGATSITIHGTPATVGWIKRNPDDSMGLTPAFEVKSGGEDIIIVEGGVDAFIAKKDAGQDNSPEHIKAYGRPTDPTGSIFPAERPGFLQLDHGTLVQLRSMFADRTCWYVSY